MSGYGERWSVRALVGAVAVLLPVGAWSAATVDPGPQTTVAGDGRVGAAGLGQAGLLDEPAPDGTVPVSVVGPTTTSPAPGQSTTRPTGPTTTARPTTSTTARPATTTTTVAALPPGHTAVASSWSAEREGLTVRVRMEPEKPVAGETVRFHVSVTSVDRCCHAFLDFGDDNNWILHDKMVCTYNHELTPGAHSFVVSHTYAEAGAYLAELKVHDGWVCGEPLPATGPPFRHLELPACVAVGPGTAAATGCKPRPSPYPVFPTP
jgi:hypothetical protein